MFHNCDLHFVFIVLYNTAEIQYSISNSQATIDATTLVQQ